MGNHKKRTKAFKEQANIRKEWLPLVGQFRVLRTGTLSEIRPDNMYQSLCTSIKKNSNTGNLMTNYYKFWSLRY